MRCLTKHATSVSTALPQNATEIYRFCGLPMQPSYPCGHQPTCGQKGTLVPQASREKTACEESSLLGKELQGVGHRRLLPLPSQSEGGRSSVVPRRPASCRPHGRAGGGLLRRFATQAGCRCRSCASGSNPPRESRRSCGTEKMTAVRQGKRT